MKPKEIVMSKYIDAEKLKAEIERRMTENCELGKKAECFSHRAVEDNDILALIDSLQQEQPEVDLENFTEKMNAWKERYNFPDRIPTKATMAFTARMFYQYPDVARLWYEQLPKATMD